MPRAVQEKASVEESIVLAVFDLSNQLGKLGEVLRSSPGGCPVQLVIQLESGSEAVLTLKGTRVEPSDGMLARLEKLFGEKVAELR